jgi:hypothetical protein
MADLTTSDAGFWVKSKAGGMVPYNHPDAAPGTTADPTKPAGGTGGAPAPAASPTAPGSGTPGMPGTVDPALKNPAPATAKPLAPSPTPAIGMGNTIDQGYGKMTATDGRGELNSPGADARRVQAPGLTMADGSTANTLAGSQPPNPQAEMQNALRGQIMGMLGTNVNAASVTDADIAPESRAFAGAAERYGAARRAEVAQQASHEGGGGWVDQRLDKLSQDTGQAVGANDAALVSKKLDARRAQLNSAMTAAQSMGMEEEANNLKRQLANLDASVATRGQDVTREQTGVQRDLGNLDASTRIYLGDLNAKLQAQGLSSQERLAQMDNEMKKYGIDVQGKLGELDNALRLTLGNRQLDLGYDQLGVNVAQTQAGLNRDAVMAGLG